MRLTLLLALLSTMLVTAEEIQRPTWASDFGTDQFGTWADIRIDADVQRMRYIPGGVVQMRTHHARGDGGSIQPIPIAAFWLADSECTQGMFLTVSGLSRTYFLGPTSATSMTFNYNVNEVNDWINRIKKGDRKEVLDRHYSESLRDDADQNALDDRLADIKSDIQYRQEGYSEDIAALKDVVVTLKKLIAAERAKLGDKAQLPAAQIAWNEVDEFCKNLKKVTSGATVMLPSEAQLEWASHAGVPDEQLKARIDDLAWHAGNSGDMSHPVKTKAPNAWGIYDLFGNLHEWSVALPRSWIEPTTFDDPRPMVEAEDAYPVGDKFVTDGTVVAINSRSIVVRTITLDQDGTLKQADYCYYPKSVPMPRATVRAKAKDSMGLEQGMVKTMREQKVGDRVRISWQWKWTRRLESIKRHELKALFGGSFNDTSDMALNMAYRDGDGPGLRLFHVGFRIVIPATPPSVAGKPIAAPEAVIPVNPAPSTR